MNHLQGILGYGEVIQTSLGWVMMPSVCHLWCSPFGLCLILGLDFVK